MSLIGIECIWHRKITAGDFFNIERSAEAGPQGGGGQMFIDIPNAAREDLFAMLGLHAPDNINGSWPTGVLSAKVIGNPSVSGELQFDLNRRNDRRYRIRNQNRQSVVSERHPAWTSENGFPTAPDDVRTREDAETYIQDGVRIFIVKSCSEGYYAGFTRGTTMPETWPPGIGLEALFDQEPGRGLITLRSSPEHLAIPSVVYRILEAWKRQPNVLLYGPTGTGKTHAMSVLWQLLGSSDPEASTDLGLPIIMLEPEEKINPFRALNPPPSLPMPKPIIRDWVTFHQNYGYEDFVIGLRPRPTESAGGFALRPRAGRLLDLAIKVASSNHQAESAALLIDEINRGNTSRVFGEFITFMESAYRDVDERGRNNPGRVPVPLALLNTSDGESEELELASGGTEVLPAPWYFPRHVYTLASMNSVDRTVAPLDSALSRRFERIEMRPDFDVLRKILGVDLNETKSKVEDSEESNVELTARECAVLILAQLNFHIATTLGPDFEIGHTYMLTIGHAETEESGFRILAQTWDQAIMPQLQERFLTRQEELLRILKVGDDVPEGYAFRLRVGVFDGETGDRPALQPVSLGALADAELDSVRNTFRYLACNL